MLDSNTHCNEAAMPYFQSCSTPLIGNTDMTCWVEQMAELLAKDTVQDTQQLQWWLRGLGDGVKVLSLNEPKSKPKSKPTPEP